MSIHSGYWPTNFTDPRDELLKVVNRAEHAFETKNWDALKTIVESDTLALWFAVPQHRLITLLEAILVQEPENRSLVYGLYTFLSGTDEARFFSTDALQNLAQEGTSGRLMLQMAYVFDQRLRGRPQEALEAADLFEAEVQQIQPIFDARNAWPLFSAVQRGITAMLAGRLQLALNFFTEAQLRNTPPALSFLHRDALAKSALIHACFGDSTEASTLLYRAKKVPLTGSWAEAGIEANERIVSALIHPDPQEGLRLFHMLNLNAVGEMWSFYVLALYQIYEASGNHEEVLHRIAPLKIAPFPAIPGKGYTGSIFQMVHAFIHFHDGNFKLANEALSTADHSLPVVKLAQAMLHLHSGKVVEALQTAEALRTAATSLRKFNLWRLSVIASAHYTLENKQECIATLEYALHCAPGLNATEALLFLEPVRSLASARLPSWPQAAENTVTFMDNLPTPIPPLTPREQTVLLLLSQHKSRAEITAELFISLNTLKSQIRSLYRKLNAQSREEALRNALKRGLLD